MTTTDFRRGTWTRDPARVHAGLINLATFLEQHPGLPLGPVEPLCCPVTSGTDEENRAEVDRIARMLGVTAGIAFACPGYYRACRDFGGGITYTATAVSNAEIDEYLRGAA
jgi:hypothetical protein